MFSLAPFEQEKYELERNLEVSEVSKKSLAYEMQRENYHLKDCLVKHTRIQEVYEWDNSQLLSELKEQNQRLSRQLEEAGEREAELRIEIKCLREQFHKERNSLGEHFNYIKSLKGEISITLDKKAELEKHIFELIHERENLSESLDFSVGKIYSLERRQRDQEYLLRTSERELEEMRASNHYLTEKLESLSNRRSSISCKVSIMSEIEIFNGETSIHNW